MSGEVLVLWVVGLGHEALALVTKGINIAYSMLVYSKTPDQSAGRDVHEQR
jgi:hypothetical protein